MKRAAQLLVEAKQKSAKMGYELNRLSQLEQRARMVVSAYPMAVPKYHKIYTRLLLAEDSDGEYEKITDELEVEKKKLESSKVLSLIAKTEFKIWECRWQVNDFKKKLQQKKSILSEIAPTSFKVKYLSAQFEQRYDGKQPTSAVWSDVQQTAKRRKEYKYGDGLLAMMSTMTKTKQESNIPPVQAYQTIRMGVSYRPVQQMVVETNVLASLILTDGRVSQARKQPDHPSRPQPQLQPQIPHFEKPRTISNTIRPNVTKTEPQCTPSIQLESQPIEQQPIAALSCTPAQWQVEDVQSRKHVKIIEQVEKYWEEKSRPTWRADLNIKISPYKYL